MRTRDIKFRVWDQEDKVMIPHESQKIVLIPCMDSYGADTHYPSPRINTNSEKVSMEENWFNNESCFDWASGWLISERFILMQYIGLKDKVGKEIYEGDIIQDIDGGIAIVEFFHNRFTYRYIGWPIDLPLPNSFENLDFIVIGNIYENPELLKMGV